MKNLKIDVKGAASLAVLFLTLINQFLSMRGQGPLPINSDELNYWVSTGLTGAVAIYGWFSNRQLTKSTSQSTNVSSTTDSQSPKKGADSSEDAK